MKAAAGSRILARAARWAALLGAGAALLGGAALAENAVTVETDPAPGVGVEAPRERSEDGAGAGAGDAGTRDAEEGAGVELELAPDGVSPETLGGKSIGRDEFAKLFIGKTVYFELLDGTPWGREYYAPDGRRTVFVYWDGRCFEGRWAQKGPRYCFYYRNQPSCWLTYWREGRIIVMSEEGMRQRVGKIVDDEPLSCQPAAVSWSPIERSRRTAAAAVAPNGG